MKKYLTFNSLMQAGLIFFTISGLLLVAMKLPQYGLLLTLISQIFWFYSSYKAWKDAGQIGILVNTCIYSMITLYGVINYWFL